MISEPGIYDLSDAEYLADPVVEPSLNNSTATKIVHASPAHAWASHPRLGRAPDDDDATDPQSFGRAVHQMFLHGESKIAVLNVQDFRTKKAQELRDEAIAAGRTPMKADRFDAVNRVVAALERFRLRTGAFSEGAAEKTVVWREGAQWGRCKVDWLPNDPEAYLWDLKTVTGRADVQTWSRSAFNFGYDLQAAYYARGCECVRGEPPAGMKFCVVETSAPFAIKTFEMTPAALDEAAADISYAISVWARCRETGNWPAYGDETEWLDAPPWRIKERAWRRLQGETRLLPSTVDPALIALMEKAGNLGG